jgi:hypothetical protein
MLPQCPALLQESIDKLEQLRVMLDRELADTAPSVLPPEHRLGKELLLSIGVLLPKLQAARRTQLHALLAARGCTTCNE